MAPPAEQLQPVDPRSLRSLVNWLRHDVVDLGVNCDVAKFEEAVAQGASVIACSSLLTTTMTYMKEVVQHFKGKSVKIIIGGAPVTQAYCDEIGAHGYSEDANGAVKLVDKLLSAG